MKAVKGRYNGSVVVLDEPAPVDHEVEVVVQFPEEGSHVAAGEHPLVWHWRQSQARLKDLPVSVAEEVIRQRRME